MPLWTSFQLFPHIVEDLFKFFLRKKYLWTHITSWMSFWKLMVTTCTFSLQITFSSPSTSFKFGAILVSFLFGRKQMWLVLSVAFEQLVDEAQLILLLDGIEGWEGVPLILQYSHLGSVKVLPVGETCHPCVTALLTLKAWCENLEELWNQILLLQENHRTWFKLNKAMWLLWFTRSACEPECS